MYQTGRFIFLKGQLILSNSINKNGGTVEYSGDVLGGVSECCSSLVD